ncbi:MAG: hypothetical protein V9G23_10655 [Giesbergeria sp.]
MLRAPHHGSLIAHANIGDQIEEGQLIAEIESISEGLKTRIVSPFKGVLRGFVHPEVEVTKGMKIGDVDRRNDPTLSTLVSDKALAIGGGVLEAVTIKLNELNAG